MLHGLRDVFKDFEYSEKLWHCVVLLLSLSAILCGCGSRQLTIRIDIVPNSNDNSAIAVDVVSVANGDLAKQISKLTAADWFRDKNDYLMTDSKPGTLSVKSGEWIAGQKGIPDIKIPAPKRLKVPIVGAPAPTVIVFANYLTPGPHRATLQPDKLTTILLGQDDLQVVADLKKSGTK
jgi:type VI secretion system protein